MTQSQFSRRDFLKIGAVGAAGAAAAGLAGCAPAGDKAADNSSMEYAVFVLTKHSANSPFSYKTGRL